jgi:hypothetical protein
MDPASTSNLMAYRNFQTLTQSVTVGRPIPDRLHALSRLALGPTLRLAQADAQLNQLRDYFP